MIPSALFPFKMRRGILSIAIIQGKVDYTILSLLNEYHITMRRSHIDRIYVFFSPPVIHDSVSYKRKTSCYIFADVFTSHAEKLKLFTLYQDSISFFFWTCS